MNVPLIGYTQDSNSECFPLQNTILSQSSVLPENFAPAMTYKENVDPRTTTIEDAVFVILNNYNF